MSATDARGKAGISSSGDRALGAMADWPVQNACAVVVAPDGTMLESYGDLDGEYSLASVAKLITTYAMLVALEEEAVSVDDPAGPPGSTLAHLLAHTSGLGFDADDPTLAAPGQRRIYSNAGIEAAADHLTASTGIAFTDYLTEAVLAPLGMSHTELRGSPAHAVSSTGNDLLRFVREIWRPTLIDPGTLRDAVTVKFPGVNGVVPGVGRFDPCDWGYGFERNFSRPKHWAGQSVSHHTVGHFGGAGTFLWVDPGNRVAAICLTARPFDSWALAAWPRLCDDIISVYGQG